MICCSKPAHDRIDQLARFIGKVRTGIGALVAEALREDPRSNAVRVVTALADFMVWRTLRSAGTDARGRRELMVAIVEAALRQDETGPSE
ncbi:hypothetical protein H2509_13065 [Stappia sp. F7233]|uniref:Uncharacterized protein n=1 Tax=Stappia albiluteola TaxID=2758565 RepID=A0A839AEE1_9HYPH|nr:hypothetical protein [Stappia albiluteola]MBA5778053.1 hypothetical protein [Stappia albiluteola]